MKKVFILLPVFIFLIGLLAGVFINPNNLVFQTSNTKMFSTSELFFHNMSAIICNASGILTFGISTSINIFITAFILGIYINEALKAGYSLSFILSHTLPHFTEYIAIFISGYIGFSGYSLLFSHNFSKAYLIKQGKLFLLTIPLILFAAFMEVNYATK